MLANQPPHREWTKRARRAAAGERPGREWPHRGREGSWHRWGAEEIMEKGGRRLRCCRFVMVVVDVFDFEEKVQRQKNLLSVTAH
jgi:hypothetical protein